MCILKCLPSARVHVLSVHTTCQLSIVLFNAVPGVYLQKLKGMSNATNKISK